MSGKTLQEVLLYTSIYSIIIPILLGLRQVIALTKPLRFFLFFLVVCLCFDTYSVVTASNNMNNMAGLHLYTVVEYTCIAYYFSLKSTKPNLTKAIRVSLVLFVLFACYYAFFMGSLVKYNAPVRTASAALITAMACYFMSKEMQHHYFPTQGFYITAGILLYFMVNSVGFLLYAAIGNEFGRAVSEQFGTIHSLVYLIATIFYILAFRNKPTLN